MGKENKKLKNRGREKENGKSKNNGRRLKEVQERRRRK
jgi:hypothetical protein